MQIKPHIYFWSGLLILALLAGCGRQGEDVPSGPEATAQALMTAVVASSEPPLDLQTLQQQVDEATALWQSQDITHYRVQIRHNIPTWNTQVLDMVVEDGVVVDVKQSCFPQQDCILKEVDAQTMTIQGLLDIAAELVERKERTMEVTFNPTYGYPNAVSFEDGFWGVGGFEPLDQE